MLFIKKY